MIKERLERLLNVRPNEWRDLIFFWVFNTLIWSGLSLGESVCEALFLKRFGVVFLPHMFIFCSLVAIPVSLILAAMQTRMMKTRLMAILIGGCMGSIGLCLLLIRYRLTVFDLSLGYPLLYIAYNCLTILLAAQFSILLAGHYNTLDSKRLVPIILSGSITGSIAGGCILNLLAGASGVDNLLWLWIALLLLAFIWFLSFQKSVFIAPKKMPDTDKTPLFAAESYLDKFTLEAKAVISSPILVLLAGSMLFMTIGKYFIEYQYSDIFNNYFIDEVALAKFFGIYTVISNVLALLFQNLVTGRFIQSFGVSNANLFYPVSTFLCFLGTAVSYSFIPGIFARFNQEGFRRAVFQPVSNLFYNAIPAKRRARSIAFNEGLVVPIGTVVAGVFLMMVKDHHLMFSLLALTLSAIWISLAWGQRKVYSNSLLEMLKQSQIEGIMEEEKDLGSLDDRTLKLVANTMRDKNEEVAELAADILLKYGGNSGLVAVIAFSGDCSQNLKRSIIRKSAAHPSPLTREFLLKALKSKDKEENLTALKALVCYPTDEDMRIMIAAFLEHGDIRYQAAAAAAVVKGGDLVQMMKALLVLQRLVFNKDPQYTALGIETLGSTRDERFWINLKPYLKSANPDLRLGAMKAMNLMVRVGELSEHLDILHSLLQDPVREIRSLAIQILGRVRAHSSVTHLIRSLTDRSPRNRKLALEGLSLYGTEVVSSLVSIIDDPRSSLLEQEGAVKLLFPSQNPQIREKLREFALLKIRALYEFKCDEKALTDELAAQDSEYIRMVASEKVQGIVRLVLTIVAPEKSKALRTMFKNLSSSDSEALNNAIELLQTMGERKLIYHLLPILENLPLQQTVDYARRVFRFERVSSRQVIGKYLLSVDPDLREAAVYTIGRISLAELGTALSKLAAEFGPVDQKLAALCDWALNRLHNRTTGRLEPAPASDSHSPRIN